MARIKTSFTREIDDYLQTLNRLGAEMEGRAKQAIFEGAKIIADQVKRNIEALPTDEEWGTTAQKKRGPSREEKTQIKNGLGIARMKSEQGVINTKIGYEDAGYNEKGKAIQMIARSVNSGTSFMRRNPFFTSAVRQSSDRAKQKMIEVAEKKLEEITK